MPPTNHTFADRIHHAERNQSLQGPILTYKIREVSAPPRLETVPYSHQVAASSDQATNPLANMTPAAPFPAAQVQGKLSGK